MKRVSLLWIVCAIGILGAPEECGADCIACTESYGLRVELVDGTTVDGYLAWNHHALARLMGCQGFEYLTPRSYHQDLIHPEGPAANWPSSDDERFALWTEFMNLTYRQPPEAQRLEDGLTVYAELAEIVYPFRHFLGVNGTVHTIPPDRIRSIAPNPALTLRVATTGLDSLPHDDVVRLQRDKPRFWVVEELAVSGYVYAVYDPDLTLEELLSHLACAGRGSPGTIFIGNWKLERFAAGDTLTERGAGGYGGRRLDLGSLHAEEATAQASRFLIVLNQTRDDLGKLTKEYEKAHSRTESDRLAFLARRDSLVNERFQCLGDRAALRARGILSFGYAWD